MDLPVGTSEKVEIKTPCSAHARSDEPSESDSPLCKPLSAMLLHGNIQLGATTPGHHVEDVGELNSTTTCAKVDDRQHIASGCTAWFEHCDPPLDPPNLATEEGHKLLFSGQIAPDMHQDCAFNIQGASNCSVCQWKGHSPCPDSTASMLLSIYVIFPEIVDCEGLHQLKSNLDRGKTSLCYVGRMPNSNGFDHTIHLHAEGRTKCDVSLHIHERCSFGMPSVFAAFPPSRAVARAKEELITDSSWEKVLLPSLATDERITLKREILSRKMRRHSVSMEKAAFLQEI